MVNGIGDKGRVQNKHAILFRHRVFLGKKQLSLRAATVFLVMRRILMLKDSGRDYAMRYSY